MQSKHERSISQNQTCKILPQPIDQTKSKQKPIKISSQPLLQFEQLLECQICYSVAQGIMMCPHCSKIYCQNCIKKSLSIKSQCPHCRKHVKDSKSMANCQRFVNEVKNIVQEVLKKQENFKCDQHDILLNYYCIQCSRSVCCECKMFGSHKEHQLVPIQKKFQQKYQKLRSLLAQLKVSLKEKNATIEQINEQLDSTNKQYQKQLHENQEIQKNFDDEHRYSMVKHKEDWRCNILKLENKIQKLNELKKSLRSETSKVKKEGTYQFRESFKSKLQDYLLTVNSYTESVKTNALKDQTLGNSFTPPYIYFKFKIQHFSRKQKEQKCVIFSDPVNLLDCKWKLKVYPNGSQFVQGKFLSIYLVMVSKPIQSQEQKGPVGDKKVSNLYEYQIEIIQQNQPKQNTSSTIHDSLLKEKDKSKTFSREYSSSFDVGQSWGYNKFIEIKQIYDSGYVNSEANDSLIIKCGIRRPDYFTEMKTLIKKLHSIQNSIQNFDVKNQQNQQNTLSNENIEQSKLGVPKSQANHEYIE